MIKLDHVVYFTKKSPAEVVNEQEQVGRHAVVGGSHVQWGTYNALMYVKNAYLEWLSIERKEIAENAKHPLTEQLLYDVEGWGTICLSVNNIDEFNNSLIEKGFLTSGVLPAERKTTSGEVRKWKMVFVEQRVSDQLPMPFFIEWEETEEQRLEKLRADGTITSTSSLLEIKECIFNVNDPLESVSAWSNLLAIDTADSQLQLENVTLTFRKKKGKERLTEVLIEQAIE
ncbi:VOC family protein [Sporosarcina sp. CAU 1771]